MGFLSKLEGDAKAMVMTAENFFAGLEPEVANYVGPMIAKIRTSLSNEIGNLETEGFAAVKAMIAKSVGKFEAQIATDPLGAIAAIAKDVVGQIPNALSVAETVAVHGLVTAAVASIAG
jgi:hypothetical protein